MQISYHGHSIVKIKTKGYTILIDPFITGNRLTDLSVKEEHPDVILLTHGHNDHVGAAQREYYVLAEGESGDLIRKYFSRLDVIFDDPDIQDVSDLRHTFRKATSIDLHGQVIPKEALTEDFLMDLADAIAADCEAGNMVQLGAFHPGVIMETVNSDDPIRMIRHLCAHLSVRLR